MSYAMHLSNVGFSGNPTRLLEPHLGLLVEMARQKIPGGTFRRETWKRAGSKIVPGRLKRRS